MELTQILPLVAAVGFVIFAFALAVRPAGTASVGWMLPAALCILFAVWTLYAVLGAGLTGFWDEHVNGLWGNQIWFDLLLAASVALSFLVPEARRLGMRPLLWVIIVICTGSIGLLAMTARVMALKAAEDQSSD